MKSGNRNLRRAVLLGAILAIGSAGADGSTSELAPGWLSVENAVETHAVEQVVGGQYPAIIAVVLQVFCIQCAIDASISSAIDWAAVYRCMWICDMAF